MYHLLSRLFPLCRSITGDGVRETFRILQETIPLTIDEYPTGTPCFDWTIPDEWNIRDAWIKDPEGRKIVDFRQNNLHVLAYSTPFSGKIDLDELQRHLHSQPDMPDVIPYATSYYERRWGFCLADRQRQGLTAGMYEVNIDASLAPGNLLVADALLPGKSRREIFFSSYVCHPSMANDSLSGVVLASALYRRLAERQDRRYSYRFIFAPETIGTIAYLSRHHQAMKENIHAGLVLTCLGDRGNFHYKQTCQGNHELDRVVENVLAASGRPYRLIPFSPLGSDERQYASPGINLPAGSLMRSIYGFPEYHTSADNLEFVAQTNLAESLEMYVAVVEALEGNRSYVNLKPFCEPFLTKYGLCHTIGGLPHPDNLRRPMMALLTGSNGRQSLLDIADKFDVPLAQLTKIAPVLVEKGLLREIETD